MESLLSSQNLVIHVDKYLNETDGDILGVEKKYAKICNHRLQKRAITR